MKKLLAAHIEYLPEATVINVAVQTSATEYRALFSSHRNDINQTTINNVMDYGTVHQEEIAETMFDKIAKDFNYNPDLAALEEKDPIVAADDLQEQASGYIREMERSHNVSERTNAEALNKIIRELGDLARKNHKRKEPQELSDI